MSDIIPLKDSPAYSHERTKSGLTARFEIEAAALANLFADDLAGYVVFCVDKRGEWSLSFRCDDDPNIPIGVNMVAGLTISAVHREMIFGPMLAEREQC